MNKAQVHKQTKKKFFGESYPALILVRLAIGSSYKYARMKSWFAVPDVFTCKGPVSS